MPRPELSIVIVNWNSKEFVRKCLASVFADSDGADFEVIVVDSGSFDGCREMIEERYPEVRYIQSEQNIGFGQANNLGALHSVGEDLLLLNPDTEVIAQAIKRLREWLRDLPGAGIVGCQLLNTDGSLQATCVQPLPTILNQVFNARGMQRLFPRVPVWMSARTFQSAPPPQRVPALVGACMMMKRAAFLEVGGFSRDYFMYGEDIDLCYKMRQAGREIYYARDVPVVHHGGGTTSGGTTRFAAVMMRESTCRLLRKTRGEAYGRRYRLAMGLAAGARIMLLCLFAPVGLVTRPASLRGSLRKWSAILNWSLGREGWVNDYDSPQSPSASGAR